MPSTLGTPPVTGQGDTGSCHEMLGLDPARGQPQALWPRKPSRPEFPHLHPIPPGKNVLLVRLALPYIAPALHALAKLCGQKCRSFIRILGIREACVLVQFACAAKAGRQASTDHDYNSAAFNTPPVYEGPVTATTHGNEIAPSTWLEFSSSLMDALTRIVLFGGDVAKLFFGVIAVSRCI